MKKHHDPPTDISVDIRERTVHCLGIDGDTVAQYDLEDIMANVTREVVTRSGGSRDTCDIQRTAHRAWDTLSSEHRKQTVREEIESWATSNNWDIENYDIS